MSLERWWDAERERDRAASQAIAARDDADWGAAVSNHVAHRHEFYEHLAEALTVQEYASFLLENWAYPSFLGLVSKTLAVQKTERGRAAILRNIEDEHVPEPHADLMRRLFLAVKRAAGPVPIAVYPSLIDRTLVFYYGYYLEPWHLVGSLFAVEAMARHRLIHMGRGLERLGFGKRDCEFIRVHLDCDDDHAREWLDDVIAPSIARDPSVRPLIAEGIATCLETSKRYLDDLVERASLAKHAPLARSAQ